MAVRLLTGFQLEPVATRFPTLGSVRFPSSGGNVPAPAKVFKVRTLMSSWSSGILIVSDAAGAVGLIAGVTLAPWMVLTEKSSWNGNATYGSTCFFLVCLDWLFCNRDWTQSCCLNSALADILDWVLGEVTAFKLESHVHSLISWSNDWLNALSESLWLNQSVPGLVSFQ